MVCCLLKFLVWAHSTKTLSRPQNASGDHIPPAALLNHCISNNLLKPCCLCLLKDITKPTFVEASFDLAKEGAFSGEYIAKCAEGFCGYIGMQIKPSSKSKAQPYFVNSSSPKNLWLWKIHSYFWTVVWSPRYVISCCYNIMSINKDTSGPGPSGPSSSAAMTVPTRLTSPSTPPGTAARPSGLGLAPEKGLKRSYACLGEQISIFML